MLVSHVRFPFSFSIKPQEAILILITMFWGGTFLAVQYAVTMSDPFFFVGLRFCNRGDCRGAYFAEKPCAG